MEVPGEVGRCGKVSMYLKATSTAVVRCSGSNRDGKGSNSQ